MKILKIILLIILVASFACKTKQGQEQQGKTLMLLDSIPSGKNVIMINRGDTVRPGESVSDLSELPSIMQSDLDTSQKNSSREIRYVKKGEAVHPAE